MADFPIGAPPASPPMGVPASSHPGSVVTVKLCGVDQSGNMVAVPIVKGGIATIPAPGSSSSNYPRSGSPSWINLPTTKKVTAKLSAAAATTNPTIFSEWEDVTSTGITEGHTEISFNGTTNVDAIAAPTAGTRRVMRTSVYNGDTAAVTVIIEVDTSGAKLRRFKITLAVDQTLEITPTNLVIAPAATTTPGIGGAIYGDGSDGTVSFDGVTTPVAGATLVGSTYTLTRNIMASAVNFGDNSHNVTVNENGYAIFCTGLTTYYGSSFLHNNGGPGGATGTAGSSAAVAKVWGQNATTAGAAGTASSAGTSLTMANACGGAGGAGGHGNAALTGGVNVFSAPNAGAGIIRAMPYCLSGAYVQDAGANSIWLFVNTGQGGASGGGDAGAVTAGGGGGGGGGVVLLYSKYFASVSSSGTQIQAKGGAGGTPVAGNTGGGGGGGGGVAVIITSAALPAGVSAAATGGAGGTKAGAAPATNGSNGADGIVVLLIN